DVVATISCYTSIVFNRFHWLRARFVLMLIQIMIFFWSMESSIFSPHYEFFEFVSYDLTWFVLLINTLYLSCNYILALVIHQSIQENHLTPKSQHKKSKKNKHRASQSNIMTYLPKKFGSQNPSKILDGIILSQSINSNPNASNTAIETTAAVTAAVTTASASISAITQQETEMELTRQLDPVGTGIATSPLPSARDVEPVVKLVETVDHIRYNVDNVPTLSELKLQYVHRFAELLISCSLSTNIVVAILYWCLLFPYTTNVTAHYLRIRCLLWIIYSCAYIIFIIYMYILLNGFEYVVSPCLILFEQMCSSRRVEFKKFYLPLIYASILSLWIYGINRHASVNGNRTTITYFKPITNVIVFLFIAIGVVKNFLISAYMTPIYVKDECIEDVVGIIPEEPQANEFHTTPGEGEDSPFYIKYIDEFKCKIVRVLFEAVRTLSKQQAKKLKKKLDTIKHERTQMKDDDSGNGDPIGHLATNSSIDPEAQKEEEIQDREEISVSLDSSGVSARIGLDKQKKSESEHSESAHDIDPVTNEDKRKENRRRTKSGYNYVIQDHMDSDDEALVAL
ncbi:hypothetical protein RFI_23481, partial [Reticulomyxa filosa]